MFYKKNIKILLNQFIIPKDDLLKDRNFGNELFKSYYLLRENPIYPQEYYNQCIYLLLGP